MTTFTFTKCQLCSLRRVPTQKRANNIFVKALTAIRHMPYNEVLICLESLPCEARVASPSRDAYPWRKLGNVRPCGRDTAPHFGTVDQWKQKQTQQNLTRRSTLAQCCIVSFRPAVTAPEAAGRLFVALSKLQYANSTWWGVNSRRLYWPFTRWYTAQATRILVAKNSTALLQLLGTCEYVVGLYPQWEDCQRRDKMMPDRDIEKSLK